ncbi:MAG: hypothetical protein AB7T27_03810 [Kiritimatiellia bacterium]
MKAAKHILILLLALTAPGILRADFADAFQRAAQAYDAEQYKESADLYESLVNEGAAAPEVFFNLGNARFKNGEIGLAVLNYRRAQYFTPRDPDIRANMDYAMGRNGAVRWRETTVAQFSGRWSLREWAHALIVIYWLAAVAAILWMLDAARRPVYLRLLIVFAVLAVACITGLRHWKSLQRIPEAVVINDGLSAFFAPIENSTAHFSLPAGSLVRTREQDGHWLKVEADGKEGWIPADACRKVYAWLTADMALE